MVMGSNIHQKSEMMEISQTEMDEVLPELLNQCMFAQEEQSLTKIHANYVSVENHLILLNHLEKLIVVMVLNTQLKNVKMITQLMEKAAALHEQ